MKYITRIIAFTSILTAILSCKNESKMVVEPTVNRDLTEQYRPQYHFTPDANWMNDPNGLVYFDNEYHLFYQYYPDSTVWGPMHWGHAVSEDMINWHDLPIALYPDSLGLIFSGSCVIDWQNTSGFGTTSVPPMVAIFTHHQMSGEKTGKIDFQYQSLAYSIDKGRTWTKYEGNPVIANPGIKDFRDPKVIRDDIRQQWVMALAAKDKVMFYTSKDLKTWKNTSEFGIANDKRLWECPDLFPIRVEGEDGYKWVLITSMQTGAPNGGTGTSYWVGDFDGASFKVKDPAKEQQWLDYGKDNYAFVTWSDITLNDGRRLGIGWMSNWQYAQQTPSKTWRSAMTLPRSVKCIRDGNQFYLTTEPVAEIDKLINSTDTIAETTAANLYLLQDNSNGLSKLKISFKKPSKGSVIINYSNGKDTLKLGYNADLNHYFIDRLNLGVNNFNAEFAGLHTAKSTSTKDEIELVIYLDRASVEVFADEGRIAMTDVFFVANPLTDISVRSDNAVKITNAEVSKMKPAQLSKMNPLR